MLTFVLVSSKVCIKYSRCPCNKLWWRWECLNIQTIEVNRASTKKLLNNFLGQFFRAKLKQFLRRGSKMDCLLKKSVKLNGKKWNIKLVAFQKSF